MTRFQHLLQFLLIVLAPQSMALLGNAHQTQRICLKLPVKQHLEKEIKCKFLAMTMTHLMEPV